MNNIIIFILLKTIGSNAAAGKLTYMIFLYCSVILVVVDGYVYHCCFFIIMLYLILLCNFHEYI